MTELIFKEVLDFYKGKRVLITGNTGFKGSWLTFLLLAAGAEVTGYSLEPPTDPSLFHICGLDRDKRLKQIYGDVRDLDALKEAFKASKPEIVLHLAAQPIVRDSYKDPVYTYETNVMGTVNICDAVRTTMDDGGRPVVCSFLNVTTDKVYKNNEWEYGYRECDPLDGYDPYSNSKSCSELVTHSYISSFFDDMGIAVSTARAGNVIGGGDFSNDRIIPDSVRALCDAVSNKKDGAEIIVRNPYSTRPYQHVLEPLFMYLTIAMKQYEDKTFAGYYNVGPDDCDCVSTGKLVDLFCDKWAGDPKVSWKNVSEANAPHEASFLKLDCSKIKSVFGWRPRWHIDEAIEETIRWTEVWMKSGGDRDAVAEEMDREIREYVGN